jgi:LAO/AO transport system kinase
MRGSAVGLADRVRAGDPRALPRLISLLERGSEAGQRALADLYPNAGQAHVVGITGPPGAGKSTLVNALIGAIRDTGRRVAVLAIDPSSPASGGAVLGDRIRMMERHADDNVFIRSMAARGRLGGLAAAAADVVHLFDAVGFDVVLIETVGAGQDGVEIARLAQTVVVLQVPGLGDGVQAIKAGILEVGDILVVNKADQPGAPELGRVLRQAVMPLTAGEQRQVPVVPVMATTGDGIDRLLAAIDEHRAYLSASGRADERAEIAARSEVLTRLRTEIERRLDNASGELPAVQAAIADVAARRMTSGDAVRTLIEPLLRHRD